MAKKMTILLALLAVFIGGAYAQSVRFNDTPDRNNLKGLTSVEVQVLIEGGRDHTGFGQPIKEEDVGLDSTTIQSETELRLRQGGLGIRRPPGDVRIVPALIIRVVFAAAGSTITVSLIEEATLNARDSLRPPHMVVTTWTLEAVGPRRPAAATGIRNSIRDQVSEFLNQWLADNGR